MVTKIIKIETSLSKSFSNLILKMKKNSKIVASAEQLYEIIKYFKTNVMSSLK